MAKNTVHPHASHFAQVPNVSIPRSKFDLSHGYKTTLDGGYLVPVMVTPMVPGDSFKCHYKHLCRMTTPIVPFMDNVHLSYFTFFVPNRLVWDNFEDYITGSHKGQLGTIHTKKPTIKINGTDCASGSLCDYFGLNCSDAGTDKVEIDALPFRAYTLIWSEWFRDENLQAPIDINTSDTVDAVEWATISTLRKRGKRKDYFTSALPWVQKGPSVELPLGGIAPVYGSGTALVLKGSGTTFGYLNNGSTGTLTSPSIRTSELGSPSVGSVLVNSSAISGQSNYTAIGVPTKDQLAGLDSGLIADLSTATSATINDLRQSFAIQHVLERDARNGSRYCEALMAHWGVRSPDMRLQRPEYVAGYTSDFLINSVAQTSGTSAVSPQGNLAAVAKSSGVGSFQYSAVEHGTLITMAVITTDLTYQQGINRNWFKFDRFDEFFPEFAHLGEQPIFEKEIYSSGDEDADNAVFGYQERYSEMRYFPSLITGKLRSSDPSTLDYWHLAQFFSSPPSLSEDFITEDPPFARVLAVQNEPQFVLDMWFDLKAIRPLPMFSVPSLLDHF